MRVAKITFYMLSILSNKLYFINIFVCFGKLWIFLLGTCRYRFPMWKTTTTIIIIFWLLYFLFSFPFYYFLSLKQTPLLFIIILVFHKWEILTVTQLRFLLIKKRQFSFPFSFSPLRMRGIRTKNLCGRKMWFYYY